MGLEVALTSLGIPFARSKVGDRYVVEMLKEKEWTIGGESSGHILNLNHASTGDGIISSIQVLAAICNSGLSLAELRRGIEKFPQILINVRYKKGTDPLAESFVQQEIAAVEEELGTEGRVLIRASGTEPVIRVMVEGKEKEKVTQFAERIAKKVEEAC